MPSSKVFQILLCDGPSCGLCHDSATLKEAMQAQIAGDASLSKRVAICDYTCFGRCSEGPNMLIREVADLAAAEREPKHYELNGVRGFYADLDAKRCERIVREHCGEDAPVANWVDDY